MRKFKAIVRYQMADILFSMSVFFIVFGGLLRARVGDHRIRRRRGHAVQGHVPVDVRVSGSVRRHIVFHRLQVRAAMRRDPRPGVSEHRAVVRRGGARLRPGRPAAFGGAAPVGRAVDSRAVRRGLRAGASRSAWTLAFNLAIVFLSYALVVLHGRVGKAPFLLGASGVRPPGVRAGAHRLPGGAGRGRRCRGGSLPALGFTAQGIVLANPIVLFAVVAVLSALAAYLLTRRAEVR